MSPDTDRVMVRADRVRDAICLRVHDARQFAYQQRMKFSIFNTLTSRKKAS
jgi:hypothetical protein